MTSSTSAATGRAGTRRRAAAALGLALLLGLGATACGVDDGNAEAGNRRADVRRGPVSVDFEAATLPDGTRAEQAELVAAAAHDGAQGVEIRARGGEAYVSWDTAALGDGPYWSFRAWVRVVDWTDGESVDLFTVRNGEVVNNFDLFVAAPNRNLMWDLFREDFAETAAAIVPGQWHLVEARGSFAGSTYAAEVRIDGVVQPSIRSTGQVPSHVSEFVLGSIGTEKTNTTQFDGVAITVGDAPIPFLAPTGAPSTTPPGGQP
jgi:hypothetical protein